MHDGAWLRSEASGAEKVSMAVKRAYGTPGGYIGREKVRRYNAVLLGYFAYCLVSAFLIWTFVSDTRYSTVVWVLIALAPLATSIARRSLGHLVHPWIAGLTGEREIAKQLEPLLHRGYDVIHDADLGRAAVDHIVVGPSGVFAIETKAFYTTETARKRAVASAAAVKNRLAMCGLDASVIAVVALPRSAVAGGSSSLRQVHVVEGHSLASWIARRPVALSTIEIDGARHALLPYLGV